MKTIMLLDTSDCKASFTKIVRVLVDYLFKSSWLHSRGAIAMIARTGIAEGDF